MNIIPPELSDFLHEQATFYNRPEFIDNDPICIPHMFTLHQDIEIAGLLAATLAWGNRTVIIGNSKKLMNWMDNRPYDFIMNHSERDLKKIMHFVHRTFNGTDLLYFIHFLRFHYQSHQSLEDAFVPGASYKEAHVEAALKRFHEYFFSLEHPARTRKHVATPDRNSACKRLNMFLRWMVRTDKQGVDFGIWKKLNPAQLICPLDVHVARVAQKLGMLPANKADWKNALHLTTLLRQLNSADPVLFDFALFSLGVMKGLPD